MPDNDSKKMISVALSSIYACRLRFSRRALYVSAFGMSSDAMAKPDSDVRTDRRSRTVLPGHAISAFVSYFVHALAGRSKLSASTLQVKIVSDNATTGARRCSTVAPTLKIRATAKARMRHSTYLQHIVRSGHERRARCAASFSVSQAIMLMASRSTCSAIRICTSLSRKRVSMEKTRVVALMLRVADPGPATQRSLKSNSVSRRSRADGNSYKAFRK